jgi:hypothetical protein
MAKEGLELTEIGSVEQEISMQGPAQGLTNGQGCPPKGTFISLAAGTKPRSQEFDPKTLRC